MSYLENLNPIAHDTTSCITHQAGGFPALRLFFCCVWRSAKIRGGGFAAATRQGLWRDSSAATWRSTLKRERKRLAPLDIHPARLSLSGQGKRRLLEFYPSDHSDG
jgi:hypothetical protein